MAKRFLAVCACTGFIALAFVDINGFVDAGRRGVLLFGRNVMPILFPFFFMSGFLVEVGFFSGFKKFGKAAPIFALSLLSGYPTGARLLGDLYKRGEVSRAQAIRIATYTSTCSPIFIIATVGACFYQSISVGALIFTAHVLGAVLNGVVYCRMNFKEAQASADKNCFASSTNTSNNVYLRDESRSTEQSHLQAAANSYDISTAISNSLYSAIQSILAVGGLIIIFFIASNLAGGGVFVSSLLEMTNGVYMASTFAPHSLVIPCAIVSFGGLCVTMQGFVFMSSFRMPFWFYLLYKVTHTVFAVIICLILAAAI